MTGGQWRVFGLIVVLFLLEMIAHPGVNSFAKNALSNFTTALNQAGGSK